MPGAPKEKIGWALMVHTCNPSYSGGRDQFFLRPYLEKKKNHKKYRAGGVAQGKGPEFKPQYQKK
jgi:hypothetical protein